MDSSLSYYQRSPSRPSRRRCRRPAQSASPPLLLLLLLFLPLLALAQRGGTPPSTDSLGASCNRYPPRHHVPCLATTQVHFAGDTRGAAPAHANKLPATSVNKIKAFLLKAKPVNALDASKRAAHVAKRVARAMADATKADGKAAQAPGASRAASSQSLAATSLAVMQVLMDTRFAPILLYDDAAGLPAARALADAAQSGTAPTGLDLDAFSAHAIVRTVSGVFACYDAEQAPLPPSHADTAAPTACDMETLHRLIQLVDVLTAWLDSVRSHAPMAAHLDTAGAPTLAGFLARVDSNPLDKVTARAIVLDLVTSSLTASLAPSSTEGKEDEGADQANKAATARTLLDVYYLPLHYFSAARPGPATHREAREAAWRALARVQTLGAAVRKTKAEYPFWFGLMKSGVQWVLGPVAKMMLKGSLEAKMDDMPPPPAHGEL